MRLFLCGLLFLAGCAATETRHVSSAPYSGQQFSCAPWKRGSHPVEMQLYVDGKNVTAVVNRTSVIHYHSEFTDQPNNEKGFRQVIYGRAAAEFTPNEDQASLDLDVRAVDGTWKKDVTKSQNGQLTMRPEIQIRFSYSESVNDEWWICVPGETVPDYMK